MYGVVMLDKYKILTNFLTISGIDAAYVKKLESETPTIIYSKKVIERNIQKIKSIIEPFGDQLYISLKAVNDLKVLKFIAALGLGADASSYPDFVLAERAKFQKISVTSVNFSDIELKKMENAIINFDNYDQLDTLSNQEIGIRLSAENIESVKNNRYSRFGFMLNNSLLKFLKQRKLEVASVHMHISPENIEQFEDMLIFLRKSSFLFPNLKVINVGGGLESYIFNSQFASVLKSFHDKIDRSIKVIFEPGSLLIEYAGLGLSKVLSVKRNAVNSALFQNFSAWMLIPWGSVEVFDVANVFNQKDFSTSNQVYSVYGNTMFEGDYLGKFKLSQNIIKDNHLFIYPVGAYNISSFRSFHGISKPNVYLV